MLVTGPATIPVPPRTGFRTLAVEQQRSGLALRWTTAGGGGGSASGNARAKLAEGWVAELRPVPGGAIVRVGPA